MTQEANQDTGKTKEQLWAELDTADGLPAAAQRAEAVASDAELQAAAAAATEQTPAEGAADKAAPSQQDASGAAAEADPYAGWPQAAKDEILGLKTLVTQLGTRMRNAEGHIGGINHQLKEQVRAAQQATAGGHNAPTAAQLAAAQGNDSALAKLKSEYPEFGDALEKVLEERIGTTRQAQPQQQQEAQPDLQQAEQLSPQEVLQRVDQMQREFAVESRHPGWQERVKTPGFIGWLGRQDREVQMLAASRAPQDAIRLLDLHAGSTKQGVTHRQQRLDAAAAIPDGRASAARPKPIEQMTKAEYWAYLDSLDSQKRS